MTLVLIFTCFVFIYLLSIKLFQKYKFYKCLSKFPGPKPLPLFGNVLLINKCSEIAPASTSLRKQFGGVFKVHFGFVPRLIFSEQKSAEFLLSSQAFIEKSYEYHFFHSWLGTGLLTSSDTKWKTRRRLLTPTFHFQILEKYISVFNEQSNILVEKLKAKADAGPFDISPFVTLCTLDIICEAAMGTKVDAQNNSNSPYVLSVKRMRRIVTERTVSPSMYNFVFRVTPMYNLQKRALTVLDEFANSVIQNRKLNFLKTKLSGVNSKDSSKRNAFLDLLLQNNLNGADMSDESIREEVHTFMFEGHDTTSSGISFTLYCLSQNPDVQQKVIEELQHILGNDYKKLPTYRDLQEMKYLEMVIKESLRLYPPVPTYSRILNEDTMFDDKILPKGLTLTLHCLLLHRDPIAFPDPDKFDPDRFLPEVSASRSPFAYVPFSAGSRNCIGQRFAMLELKSTISKVVRNYELLPVVNHVPELSVEVILKSYNGLPIRLKTRCYN